jgi:hypothetical protein
VTENHQIRIHEETFRRLKGIPVSGTPDDKIVFLLNRVRPEMAKMINQRIMEAEDCFIQLLPPKLPPNIDNYTVDGVFIQFKILLDRAIIRPTFLLEINDAFRELISDNEKIQQKNDEATAKESEKIVHKAIAAIAAPVDKQFVNR